MTNPEDIFELAKLMRMDLSQLQARLTDLTRMISGLNLPPTQPKKQCQECGLEFAHTTQLADHMVNVHDWQREPDTDYGCKHESSHFDRTLCACGSMHHYCDDCGKALDCSLEEQTDTDEAKEQRRQHAQQLREQFAALNEDWLAS